MSNFKGLVILIFSLYVGFAIFALNGEEDVSFIFDALIVPTITFFYIVFFNKKNILFLLFLLFYAFSDLMSLIIVLTIKEGSDLLYDVEYYVGNFLYILAYIFLSIKICKYLNFKDVIKLFKIHLLVLSIVNGYLLYVLQIAIRSNMVVVGLDYYLEFLYNIVMFVLLSVSFLNYFYRDNKKALYLFVGALFIVFSEIVEFAYVYISPISFLSFVSTTLTIIAFFFFYKQACYLNRLSKENSFVVLEK